MRKQWSSVGTWKKLRKLSVWCRRSQCGYSAWLASHAMMHSRGPSTDPPCHNTTDATNGVFPDVFSDFLAQCVGFISPLALGRKAPETKASEPLEPLAPHGDRSRRSRRTALTIEKGPANPTGCEIDPACIRAIADRMGIMLARHNGIVCDVPRGGIAQWVFLNGLAAMDTQMISATAQSRMMPLPVTLPIVPRPTSD